MRKLTRAAGFAAIHAHWRYGQIHGEMVGLNCHSLEMMLLMRISGVHVCCVHFPRRFVRSRRYRCWKHPPQESTDAGGLVRWH